MNRVNPLYIGILLFVILIILLFKLSSAKDELFQAKESYTFTAKVAADLSGLKEVYGDKEQIKKSLAGILNLTSLKSASLEQKIKRSGLEISSSSMDIIALNLLMGKILNSSYNITALKIKKLSETKASLHMEITW
ncbi:hypothetical protein KKG72_10355 [bacterium]|nr:hypothetical protein [bacterium]MBU1994452.1 hypothetical protein [bacterium]